MRKILALFVLGLFVVSMMPLTMAQETDEPLRERAKMIKADKELIKEIREHAREQYISAKERYNESKAQLKRLREGCKGLVNEECTQLRDNARKHSKEFLLATADRMMGITEKTLENVENSSMLQETKDKITDKLTDRLAELSAAKELVEALTEDSTREEFNAVAIALRGAWSNGRDGVKETVREAVTRVAAERFGGVFERTETLPERLEAIIEKLNATDVDKAQFNAHMDLAREAYQKMKAHLDNSEIKEATTEMQEAKEHLRDANTELRNLLKTMREKYVEAGQRIREQAELYRQEKVRIMEERAKRLKDRVDAVLNETRERLRMQNHTLNGTALRTRAGATD